MIKQFFDGNSTALHVFEAYDSYCEEVPPKAALNAVRKGLAEEYVNEADLHIIFQMALFWCGLKKGFEDNQSKKMLVNITQEEVIGVFGVKEGNTIWTVLQDLLSCIPIKPERRKTNNSNPGSKHWKAGDLYAYRLSKETTEVEELDGKYALLHCLEIVPRTQRENHIICYILLYNATEVPIDTSNILKNSIYLPVTIHGMYQCNCCDPHHNYPTNNLLYLGNFNGDYPLPNEQVPTNILYCKFIGWDMFDKHVARCYNTWKQIHC